MSKILPKQKSVRSSRAPIWRTATSELSLAAVRSKEEPFEMSVKAADSMASVCYRYYNSKNLERSCGSQDQNLSLEFSHEGEMSTSKEKVREFWELLDKTVGFMQPVIPNKRETKRTSSVKRNPDKAKPKKRRKKKAMPEPISILSKSSIVGHPDGREEQFSPRSSGSAAAGSNESMEARESPALKTMLLLMDRHVDEAALAIRCNYPLEPRVCTCGQPCCLCILFSPHWDVERSRFRRQRLRLQAEGKLKPKQDPFPDIIRQTAVF